MPSPPAPPRASDFVSNDSDDEDEEDETEEEEEEEDEESEEEEEEEPSPPPKKRARGGGGGGNDPLAKIAAIAKTLNKKKRELHKRTMTQAIEIISTLLDKHAAEIAEKIEIGDFVSDSDGMHIDVCVLPPDLRKIVSGSKNSGDWVDTLSNRIYESCAMEISFGGDNEDVLVVTLDLDDE